MRISFIAAVFVWFAAGTLAAAPGNESKFAFISGMPEIEGVLSDTLESRDPLSGVAVRRQIYVYDHEGFEIRTHVVEAACSSLPPAGDPIIVALQCFPKNPKSFTIAAMPDLYLEVFVRDEDGRIRAYQQVSGRDGGTHRSLHAGLSEHLGASPPPRPATALYRSSKCTAPWLGLLAHSTSSRRRTDCRPTMELVRSLR